MRGRGEGSAADPGPVAVTRTLVAGLATAVGVLTGVRTTFSIGVAGATVFLQPSVLPVETLGIEWTGLALWPADVQGVGTVRLVATVTALGVACALVACLGVVALLAEGSAARAHAFAVRAALGASPARLALDRVRELRTIVVGALALGVPAGIVLGLALRAAWPGSAASPFGTVPLDLFVATFAVLACAGAAHVALAVRVARSARLGTTLRADRRVGADPRAVFVRRGLSAVYVTTAATVVVSGWALARTVGEPTAASAPDDVWVIPGVADDPEVWATARRAVARAPGVAAESLAAPGALLGLGVRDITITECGNCIIGDLPTPLWNTVADVHSVGAGFHDLAGIDRIAGRTFEAQDDAEAPLVALVSRRLADVAFEDGAALGRRLRIGDNFGAWYTVVGIVDDRTLSVAGEDGTTRGAVYLSALQRPPSAGRLLVRGGESAAEVAAARLQDHGVRVEPPLSLVDYLRVSRAELRWAGRVTALLALLTGLAAGHGLYVSALQITRRRARELAVRRALGAPPSALLRTVVAERLRTSAWGLAGFVFFGTLVSAGLEKGGALKPAGPMAFAVVAGFTLVLALAAAAQALSEARRVEPSVLID